MALERDLSCNQACLSTLHAIHTSLSMLTFCLNFGFEEYLSPVLLLVV